MIFNENFEVWIPKSVINSSYILDSSSIQRFEIAVYWIRGKMKELKICIPQDFPQETKKNLSILNVSTKNQPSIQICLGRGYCSALILRSTEKALLLKINTNSGKNKTFWIPKSVITNQYSPYSKKLQKFHIKKFWISKNIRRLSN